MEYNYKNDNFLARWVANDLSPEELKKFQISEDYQKFKAINDASMQLKAPEFNTKTTFNNVKQKTVLKNNTKKVFKLSSAWMYSAAASILLIFTVFFFNQDKTSKFQTSYGEQLTITLPDNSIINLSPNSILKYNNKNWEENRNLDLIGKAYFKVEKGASFTVNTKEGNVTVLGTKFTVNSSENFFEVLCFEGKVKTYSTKNNHETILTQGKAYRAYNNKNEEWVFNELKPTWIDGETSFNNTPLKQVIKSLEKQYNLKFDSSKINTEKRFTGTFTHKNVNIALKTVFAPMKISYKLAKNSSVVLTYN